MVAGPRAWARLVRRRPRAAKTRVRRIIDTGLVVLAALTFRWVILDAYVVPSGSMLPGLLIGDRLFVAKLVYGVRLPFTTSWLARWGTPARGEVVVLRDLTDATRTLVKRVLGVAGDHVRWDGSLVQLNGKPLPRRPHPDAAALFTDVPAEIREDGTDYRVLEETLDARHYSIVVESGGTRSLGEVVVPPGMVFLFGDMRARSRDSRIFGPVPVDTVYGRATVVWSSCATPLFGKSWLCDPRTIRWARFFHRIR